MKAWLLFAVSLCFGPSFFAAPFDNFLSTQSLSAISSALSINDEEPKQVVVASRQSQISLSALAAPPLSITYTQGELVVSWPASATDWLLEQSFHLQRPVPWTRVSPTLYQNTGETRYLRLSTLAGNRFFRLRMLGPTVPGLTGHWQLDEGMGQIAENESGSGSTLSLANAAWSPGRIGSGALRFNGGVESSDGSRAWVSNANYQLLPAQGQPFSVSLWFSPDAVTAGWRGIVGNDANGSNGWHVALHSSGPGTNHLIFTATGLGASLSVTGRTLLLPGQWHQLTVTHDGAQGSLYFDSALLGRDSGTLLTHNGPIYFGGAVGNHDSFLGRIDDVRTYTTCLTEEQISLSGHWRFDENGGSFITDSSVHGHHARVTDPTAWVSGKDGSGIEMSASQVIVPNDYYDVLPPTGGPFSISLWFRPHLLPSGRSGLMSCCDSTDNGWHLTVDVESSGQTWLHFGSTNLGGTLDLRAPLTLTNGVWTKLDVTYNGGIATVYINGRKLHTESGALQASRAPLVAGAAPGAANFNGVIDDLKIYRRERDAAQIGPVASVMWETVFINTTTNIVLQGTGPAGKPLIYSISSIFSPTNGTVTSGGGAPIVTYQSGGRKGPDAFAYTVSDGEFTSQPAIVALSVVEPHWLSPNEGPVYPPDGSTPGQAWGAGNASALDAIWKTNNYYDCFFYAPGEYHTTGCKYLERATAHPGCKHIGFGADGLNRTILRLVDIWDAATEEVIFGRLHNFAVCDGFEVHHMMLDCNADNNPKYARGEPIWLRIPLTTTTRVDTITLRWGAGTVPGVATWQFGRASEFSLCARTFVTNAYLTNCTMSTGTGQVDVVSVGAETDELLLQLERRASGVDFYSLAEIEIAGASMSLPSATIPGGAESRLDPQHSIMSAVDDNPGTAWASGAGTEVQIVLPLAPNTAITQLNLHWNCQTLAAIGRLGPAAQYLIRARDQTNHQHYDVSFVRHGRTAAGWEANTFGTAQSTNVIFTDQLVILLTAKEPSVNYYSIREATVQNGSGSVKMRLPTARSTLNWGANYPVLNAFDQAIDTQWACSSQGMVGALNVSGSNLKFTHLKVIGFGTKAGRECFPLGFAFPARPGEPTSLGNVLVEDCILTEPATNNSGGVTTVVLLSTPPDTLTNAVIRRCTVAGLKSHFPTSQGFGAVHLENCLVEDCHVAVYYEPDPGLADNYGPVLIKSNQFVNVNNGVYLLSHPGAQFDSITCVGNEIILTGAGGWGIAACDTCGGGPSGSITNVTALNNIIRYADWDLRPASWDGGLHYSDIHHAVLGNNVIALGTPNALRVRLCPSGLTLPSIPPEQCDQEVIVLPTGTPSFAPCLDALPPSYRRAWFNNRDLSGSLLDVRFSNEGVDGPASQQQWPE